ncbi:hypothetical protein [Sinorhizobium americanum]|uniref:hypothetical protein n=1 Tax=Sinorhizobium americanum TaxID=194963 RepID=UPI00055AD41D|nr:hypothetical protein [Sinorhizobium americanum]
MFNLLDLSSLRRICIYVPDTWAIKLLEPALTAEGLVAVSVTTLTEFETTIRRGHYAAIITVSSCIDGIRESSDLPIIDIQSLLDDWRQTNETRRSSAFETLAFLQGTCFVSVRR